MTASTENPTANLGRTQRLVMHLLAAGGGPKSARDLAYDWPTLSEGAARSALDRLGNRRLVDVMGWEARGGRTYGLTTKGADLEAVMAAPEDLEE